MSLKALVDFSVHFESFRNIDLINQGVYRFKTNLYYEVKDKVRFQKVYKLTELEILCTTLLYYRMLQKRSSLKL